MIRPVLFVPDSRLKDPCAPVEKFDDTLRDLVRDLEETRAASPGCVGIDASQIGEMVRVAIVDTSGHKKFGAVSQGHFVLINPEITFAEGERMGREGCLSLPDFTANVKRSMHIAVHYFDINGEEHTLETEDFEAVVVQHELDHLNGILFLDRVANLATDVFRRKQK